jgi:hypothetical protein
MKIYTPDSPFLSRRGTKMMTGRRVGRDRWTRRVGLTYLEPIIA